MCIIKLKKDYNILRVKIKMKSRFVSNSKQNINIEVTIIIFNKIIFRTFLIHILYKFNSAYLTFIFYFSQ